jgi:DNA invertase Pin-like site-specific DNA recombinase
MSVKSTVHRALATLRRVPLQAIDAQIAAQEAQIAELRSLRQVIEAMQAGTAPNGADHPATTQRDQIVSFLQSRQAPMAAKEIAEGLSLARAAVQTALCQMQDKRVKRHKDGGWVAM